MTISARSTSSRSTSSRRISVSSRSNGPANTSRSSSRSISLTQPNVSGGSGRCRRSLPDWPDAHRPADVVKRLGRDRAGLLSALSQRTLEPVLIGSQLLEAGSDRLQVLDHGVRHRLLERTVARPVELALDLLWGHRADGGQDFYQVADAGLVRGTHDLRTGIGDRRADLLG